MAGETTPRYAYYVLFVLLLTYILNQWDRYLFNYLSNVKAIDQCGAYDGLPFNVADCHGNATCIKAHDCYGKYNLQYGADISKEEYGVLTSFGFTGLFAVMLLIAGRLSDVANRVLIIGVALLGWSGCTAWQGAATSFPLMLGARLGLGMFAAFSTPATYSLIASYFPPETRGTANGIYAFGVYVGGGLSSLSIIMSHGVGWRWTSYAVGILGAVVTLLLLLTVKEPERDAGSAKVEDPSTQARDFDDGYYDTIATKSPQESAVAKFSGSCMSDTGKAIKISFSDAAVTLLFAAAAMRFVGGFTIGAYMPVLFSPLAK